VPSWTQSCRKGKLLSAALGRSEQGRHPPPSSMNQVVQVGQVFLLKAGSAMRSDGVTPILTDPVKIQAKR